MNRKRILMGDEEEGAARLLQLNLEQTDDYVVRVETTPSAALAAAEDLQPDLILLDVMMPSRDGGEVARSIRASPKLRGVPVIFLTAATTRAKVSSRGGRIGGLPFLAKPTDFAEVIACLEQHLGKLASPK